MYEVAWTRLIALILGPTTYAFATMAAAFITGIALGSSLGVRLARRSTRAAFWLARHARRDVRSDDRCRMVHGILPAAGCRAHRGNLTRTSVRCSSVRPLRSCSCCCRRASLWARRLRWHSQRRRQAPTRPHGRRPASIRRTHSVQSPEPLPPASCSCQLFGLQSTFLYTSVVLLVAGCGIIAVSARGRPEGRHYEDRRHGGSRRADRPDDRHRDDRHYGGSRSAGLQASLAAQRAQWRSNGRAAVGILAGSVIAIAMFSLPEWDRDLITSGAYKYARQLSTENLESSLRAGRLEYYKEGAAGTVSVRRVAGARSLAIDGKVDASNGADMLTQRLLGLLPTMLHAGPRDALVIGLGSGVTADAVLASDEVRHLDVVEISPEVVEASAYFVRENHDVLRKPAVRLLVGDGRSHLRLSARQYDVIVSEPSNPWMAGVSALFTREFFAAARARLQSGGIFCQWSHTYEIADTDLQSIVATFASVFPDGTMWLVGEGDLLLIGSVSPGIEERLSGVAARARIGSVPALLADVGVPASASPFVLLSLFAGGPRELAQFGNGAALQSDDRMALEFSAARAMHAPPVGQAGRLRALAAGAALPERNGSGRATCPRGRLDGARRRRTARRSICRRARQFSPRRRARQPIGARLAGLDRGGGGNAQTCRRIRAG